MKALTSQRTLLAAYNKGELDHVAFDLNRYQVIESDREWECEGVPMREKTFLVPHSKGVARWTVRMRKGDVIRVECEFEV